MHRIANFFRALSSLGVLGFILLASVVIIGWSGLGVTSLVIPLGDIYTQTDKRDTLGEIKYDLLAQQINETYFVSTQDKQYADEYNQRSSELDQALDTYQASLTEASASGEDVTEELTAFEAFTLTQAEYRQTFADMVAAGAADNWDEVNRLTETTDSQTATMDKQVDDLLFKVETALTRAEQQTNQQAQQLILVGVISLVILPLLAIWAFAIAGRITQPVLTLTNAVIAVEGNQFRPDLLADAIDRGGRLGRLAQTVERMAQTIKSREEALQHDVEELREQLYETRRRKRLPTSPKREIEPSGAIESAEIERTA